MGITQPATGKPSCSRAACSTAAPNCSSPRCRVGKLFLVPCLSSSCFHFSAMTLLLSGCIRVSCVVGYSASSSQEEASRSDMKPGGQVCLCDPFPCPHTERAWSLCQATHSPGHPHHSTSCKTLGGSLSTPRQSQRTPPTCTPKHKHFRCWKALCFSQCPPSWLAVYKHLLCLGPFVQRLLRRSREKQT